MKIIVVAGGARNLGKTHLARAIRAALQPDPVECVKIGHGEPDPRKPEPLFHDPASGWDHVKSLAAKGLYAVVVETGAVPDEMKPDLVVFLASPDGREKPHRHAIRRLAHLIIDRDFVPGSAGPLLHDRLGDDRLLRVLAEQHRFLYAGPPTFVSPEQATDLILAQARLLPTHTLPLGAAFGRVLAEDLRARVDLPAFDKSAMDGFAIDFSPDTGTYRIVDSIPAGRLPQVDLKPGECARIMTGAKMPAGADRVIPFELCEEQDGVVIVTKPGPARNVCHRGENFTRETLLLRRGERLFAPDLGTLAAAGYDTVPVFHSPVVSILSTGTELVPAGSDLPSARAYDSNGPQLLGQLAAMHLSGSFRGISPDSLPELTAMVQDALSSSDVVLLSGGVSQGDFDLVPEALKQCGVSLVFEKLALKPGRPTIFGTRDRKAVFGLPGNPLAVYLIFELLVKPYLYALMGHSLPPRFRAAALADRFTRKKPGRVELVPVTLQGGTARLLPNNGPAHVNILRACDAFLRVDREVTEIPAGSPVTLFHP